MQTEPGFDWNVQEALPASPQESPAPRHSGFGIASFILGVILAVLDLFLLMIAAIAESRTPGGLDENSPQAVLIGLGLLGSMAAQLVGLTLGIVGLFMSSRLKAFAIAGTVVNGLVFAGMVAILIVGLRTP
jgi:hypothetical protein